MSVFKRLQFFGLQGPLAQRRSVLRPFDGRRILKDKAISLRPINGKEASEEASQTVPNLLAVGSQNKLAIPQGRYSSLARPFFPPYNPIDAAAN